MMPMTATTDRAALYRSILERPEDDVVRRVFADYLRENGEEERADFIEVQLAISDQYARRPNSSSGMTTGMRHPMSVWRDELKELQERERELFLAAFPKSNFMFGHLGATYCLPDSAFGKGEATTDGIVAVVSRGFVSAVRCTIADWVGGDCPNCVVAGMYSRHRSPPCDRCGGSRTTPAHGHRIVAEQPVEQIQLTDYPIQRPDPINLRVEAEWHGSALGPAREFLPNFDFDRRLYFSMREMRDSRFDMIREHEYTRMGEVAALNWARREAGLNASARGVPAGTTATASIVCGS